MEGGLWMWRKGGCGGRVGDVKGGWWMWREGVCGVKPPNRIKFYGRLIVSFQKRWSTLVDHRRSNDLPIIRRIRLWFIVIVSTKTFTVCLIGT